MIDSRTILKLLRVNQWYKNIIIFLPLVFSLKFFSAEAILISILGFVALCLASSAGYIRNDIKDLESDKLHPTKKYRPITSGKVTITQATIIFIVFLVTNTEIYSNWLKKILFLDILSISGNFIIRAISGVILIQSPMSPWLLLGIFFVAIFLAVIKRRNELEVLSVDSKKHREVLDQYNKSTLDSMILIASIMVLTTYSLYTMDSVTNDWRLIITVPIVVYVIFRQIHLSSTSQEKIISDNIINDKATGIAILVYVVLAFYLIYFAPAEFFAS